MASIDLNKLIQEQILTAAKNQELVQESVTGNQDNYDIANALNEAGVTARPRDEYEQVAKATRLNTLLGSDQALKNSGVTARPRDEYEQVAKATKLNTLLGSDKPTSGGHTPPEDQIQDREGLVKRAIQGVQELPTWAKVGAGVGAGALGAGLAAKKYLASRKAKAGK